MIFSRFIAKASCAVAHGFDAENDVIFVAVNRELFLIAIKGCHCETELGMKFFKCQQITWTLVNPSFKSANIGDYKSSNFTCFELSLIYQGSVSMSQSSLVLPRPPDDLPLGFCENLAKDKEALGDLNIG